jgi:hypothetical protein
LTTITCTNPPSQVSTISMRSLKVDQTRDKVTGALTATIHASSSPQVDPPPHGYPAHAIHLLQGQAGLSPQSVAGCGGQSLRVAGTYWTSTSIRIGAYKTPGTSLWTRYAFLMDTTMKMLRVRTCVGLHLDAFFVIS